MKPRFFNQRNRALTKIEVVVIVAVLAILAALFLPALAAAKRKSSRINCMGNLKQVGVAFRMWEGDNGDKYPMAVSVTNGGAMELVATGNVVACFQAMSNELSTPKILHCPEDTHRLWATNFSTLKNSNISYFISADAVETYPQMILDGDDNLLVDGKPVQPGILNLRTGTTIAWTKDRHHGVGNIGMADGSVQQVTSEGFQQATKEASNSTLVPGSVTNRWLIP
jgi:prepilin-type processing-associated H-X9-DG protein